MRLDKRDTRNIVSTAGLVLYTFLVLHFLPQPTPSDLHTMLGVKFILLGLGFGAFAIACRWPDLRSGLKWAAGAMFTALVCTGITTAKAQQAEQFDLRKALEGVPGVTVAGQQLDAEGCTSSVLLNGVLTRITWVPGTKCQQVASVMNGNTPVAMPTPAPAYPGYGWLEVTLGRGVLSGWFQQTGIPAYGVLVVDGQPIGAVIPSATRQDVNNYTHVPGPTGFTAYLPPKYQDGEMHTVGVMVNGQHINGSPVNTRLFKADTANVTVATGIISDDGLIRGCVSGGNIGPGTTQGKILLTRDEVVAPDYAKTGEATYDGPAQYNLPIVRSLFSPDGLDACLPNTGWQIRWPDSDNRNHVMRLYVRTPTGQTTQVPGSRANVSCTSFGVTQVGNCHIVLGDPFEGQNAPVASMLTTEGFVLSERFIMDEDKALMNAPAKGLHEKVLDFPAPTTQTPNNGAGVQILWFPNFCAFDSPHDPCDAFGSKTPEGAAQKYTDAIGENLCFLYPTFLDPQHPELGTLNTNREMSISRSTLRDNPYSGGCGGPGMTYPLGPWVVHMWRCSQASGITAGPGAQWQSFLNDGEMSKGRVCPTPTECREARTAYITACSEKAAGYAMVCGVVALVTRNPAAGGACAAFAAAAVAWCVATAPVCPSSSLDDLQFTRTLALRVFPHRPTA